MTTDVLAWAPFPHLIEYLLHTGWLATIQFIVFISIIALTTNRGLRSFGIAGRRLPVGDCVANAPVEGLTRLCLGLGLLLTFSGLYGYIGAGNQNERWPLLLALGSSALGYSAWTVCAAAAVIDALRQAYQPEEDRVAPDERLKDDEQELVGDSNRRSRYLGGLADYANQPVRGGLGSFDGGQLGGAAAEDLDDQPDPDLDEEEWPDGDLAGDESFDDFGEDLSAPGRNGRRKGNSSGGPFIV